MYELRGSGLTDIGGSRQNVFSL